jgi:ABC-type dipeptide/oligopeptide/nickel transport system permease component
MDGKNMMDYVIGITVGLVIAAAVIGVGVYIVSALGGSLTGTASTAINNTMTVITSVPTTWLPILVIVGFASLLIYLLVSGFGNTGGR